MTRRVTGTTRILQPTTTGQAQENRKVSKPYKLCSDFYCLFTSCLLTLAQQQKIFCGDHEIEETTERAAITTAATAFLERNKWPRPTINSANGVMWVGLFVVKKNKEFKCCWGAVSVGEAPQRRSYSGRQPSWLVYTDGKYVLKSIEELGQYLKIDHINKSDKCVVYTLHPSLARESPPIYSNMALAYMTKLRDFCRFMQRQLDEPHTHHATGDNTFTCCQDDVESE